MEQTTKSAKPIIGCIGLGAMGRPIATHLQSHGHDLVLYARRPEAFDQELKTLMDNGAKAASTPAELAAEVDVVLVNVMAGHDVREVLLDRDDAVIQGARPGLLVADHSTIDPDTAIFVHDTLAKQGVDFVDAPVTGGSIGAEAATLATMMGGDDHAVANLLPILAHYTKTQLHMGRSGSGQITKLCNQIAQIITIQGVAEAMQFAAAYGADQRAVMNVLSSGFANSRMLELLAPKMIDQDFTPLMKSQLLDKDAGIAKMAAKAKQLHMPGLDLVAAQLADVQERGWQEQDVSILIKALEPKKKKR